jgi:hypothetical protein
MDETSVLGGQIFDLQALRFLHGPINTGGFAEETQRRLLMPAFENRGSTQAQARGGQTWPYRSNLFYYLVCSQTAEPLVLDLRGNTFDGTESAKTMRNET